MKRITAMLFTLVLGIMILRGGGLVTNTNQSAAWARTLTREAALGVDAVYYNPAGLAQLGNGLHLSLSSQTIFQTRTINSSYPLLAGAPKDFQGDLLVPVFPSLYAAYKKDKWAFSAGFNIIGGGGSVDFANGIPSFESKIASIGASLQPIDAAIESAAGVNPGFSNVTGYTIDEMSLNGSSVYMGFQLGATYAITDMISLAIGARYVSAKNRYEGHTDGITIDAPAAYGGTQPPANYLRLVAMTPGLPAEVVAGLNGTADALEQITNNGELNTVQRGWGITPIIGLNMNLMDKLNLALKYEHHTKIELTTETEVDDLGMFPDGATTRGDLPGMISAGAQFSPIEKLTISAGFNYFLDRPAYYGKTDENGEQINNETSIDQNAYTFSASVEYKFLGILGLSAGYSAGNLGVNDEYQSDLSYGLKSSTVAGGIFVDVGELLTINAGLVFVLYDDYSKSYTAPVPYSEIYMKNATLFAIGLDINL
jgi:long-chain fatty acid transport protein